MINPETKDLFVAFVKAKRSQQKEFLSLQLENAVLQDLKNLDPEFAKLLNENSALLANDSVKFKVYQEGGGAFGTNAKSLEGKTHGNGHMYLHTTEQMSNLVPFATNRYPTCFSGVVKWDGSVRIASSETRMRLFGSKVPQQFEGHIDIDGNVEVKVVDSDFEFFGRRLIDKLICDPFSKNERKRRKYVDNLTVIKGKYESYIVELKNA